MNHPMDPRRVGVDVSTSWGRLEYAGWMDEQMSWKQACYIGDWSWLDEFHVEGPDALKFFSDFTVNNLAKFDIGQAKHAIFCSLAGKVIGEGVLMRLGEQEFEFMSRGPVASWLEFKFRQGGYRGEAGSRITKTKFQVSGPNALAVLEKVTGESLRDIGFMRFRTARIAGHDVAFLRQGMAGEVGFELHGDNRHARQIFDTVLELGREFGIQRLGTRTAMVNHLEAGFPTITHDYLPAITGAAEQDFFDAYNVEAPLDGSPEWFRSFQRCTKVKGSFDAPDISAWYRSPLELGWSRNVKFDHDFWGREALEAEFADPKRTIVSLVWNPDDVLDIYASLFREGGEPYDFMDLPRHQWFCMFAHQVVQGERPVGVATSRGYSVYFRKMLSHCVIELALAVPGTEVEVIWGDPGHPQRRIRATVARYPYKKDNRRADLGALPNGRG